MKRIFAFLALALVVAACQEDGLTVPAYGPEFAKGGFPGKPGDGGDGMVTVTFAGGMFGSEEAKIFSDNNRQLQLNNSSDNLAEIDMSFDDSHGRLGTADCWVTPDDAPASVRDYLAAQLQGTVSDGFFVVKVDRRKLGEPSDRHALEVTYTGTLGETTIGYHPYRQPTVVQLEDNVYQFTGLVRVWLSEGRTKDHVRLFCDNNTDYVTVTLTEGTS